MLPVSFAMMMGFIVYMRNKGYAPSSVIFTVSAISYFHKLNGLPDPAKDFIIAKLLTGAQNLGTVSDVRLPVTMPILVQLISALVITLHYKCVMLRAMMVLAFRAYLRVGGDGRPIQQGGARLPAFQRRGTEWRSDHYFF